MAARADQVLQIIEHPDPLPVWKTACAFRAMGESAIEARFIQTTSQNYLFLHLNLSFHFLGLLLLVSEVYIISSLRIPVADE